MQRPLNICVAGCGHWGKNYVRVLSNRTDVEVCGVADPSEAVRDRIQQAYPNLRLFSSHQDMLDACAPDAVVVATIARQHVTVISDSLQAGADVLAEKPLTLTEHEAEALCTQAEEHNRILMTAHTFLFNQSVRKLKELLHDGIAGELYYLKARRNHLGLIRDDVNAVWDLAPHDISMFMYLLGEAPCEIQAMGRRILRKDREDVAFINLRFPSGALANIQVSWADANKERVLDVVGSKARITFDDIDIQEPIRIFQKGVSVGDDSATSSYGDFKYLFRDGDILSPKIDMKEPLSSLCDAFLHAVITRESPLSDGWFGRDVVKVLCKIEDELNRNEL